jgi:PIN domain nuclease of toxin-antitoxin system
LSSVLDASALLAALNAEPGSGIVAAEIDPIISAVNLSEVVAKLVERGGTDEDIRAAIGALQLEVRDFDAELAHAAGLLRRTTRQQGLSLGDRACLALAQSLGLPVLTTDRTWLDLRLGIDVQVIR